MLQPEHHSDDRFVKWPLIEGSVSPLPLVAVSDPAPSALPLLWRLSLRLYDESQSS